MLRLVPFLFIAFLDDAPTPDKVFGKPFVNAPIGRVLDIKAALPNGVSYAWAVPEQDGIDFRWSGTTGYVFPKLPGSYYIGLAYGNPIQMAWIMVKVGDTPNPPNIPNPSPLPPDQKQPVSLIMILISEKIPTLPPFSGETKLTDYMLANNHLWKLVDKEGKDSRANVIEKKYLIQSGGKKLPYLVITDGNNIRWSGTLPASSEETLKALQGAEK